VCLRELEAWQWLAQRGGPVPVLFVACNEDSPVQDVADLGLAYSLYTQLRSAPIGSRPAVVPMTVAVNRQGTITGVFRSVEEVLRR
jgi:hypothetical protein